MRIEKGILWFCLTLYSLFLRGENKEQHNPVLFFENYSKEVGVISADDSPQSYTFTFQNSTADTLWITEVVTSCSCTTAHYSTQKIAPNERGEVTLIFNPHLREGHFFQQAFIYTNRSEKEEAAILEIKGSVTPTKDPYAGFPKAVGVLRLKRDSMFFKFERGQQKRKEVLLGVNASDESICVTAPAYPFLKFATTPQLIIAGEEAEIEVTIDGAAWKETMGDATSLLLPIQGVGKEGVHLKLELLFSE